VTGCEHLRPALGAYSLGALDADEAAEVRRHIESCPECAAEFDLLAPLPGLLEMAGGAEKAVAEPLSPAFEERLLDAFAREHADGPPRRRRPAWRLGRPRRLVAGAVGAVAAAALAFGIVLGGGAEDDPGNTYDVTFRNVGAPSAAAARADIESGDEGTTVHLWVKGLPQGEKAVYEVLCDAETWTATAGTFRMDAQGKAYVVLTTALRRGEYNAIRIVRRGHRADGRLVLRDVLTARIS
jgi:anti-sigma factor RsiW